MEGGRARDEHMTQIGKGGKKGTWAYVFDLRLNLDVRVYAKDEFLDRPAHARVARR